MKTCTKLLARTTWKLRHIQRRGLGFEVR